MAQNMNKLRLLLLLIFTVSSCGTPPELLKVDDYLYRVEFEDYDFDKLAKFADNFFYGRKKMPAACSAVRCDSLLGRNFDWTYDRMPEFVIYTKAAEGRYASLGIAAPIGILKDGQTGCLWGDFIINKLPAFTVDGINEKGVACCVNAVPQGDCGYTVGTNPSKPKLYAAMLVRYVLDRAASAGEAIALLDTRNFYTSAAFGLKEDYHFIIADSTSTYVVEFIDNRPVVLEDSKIMTNFYQSCGVTPHAYGLERYEILEKGYDSASDVEGMFELMRSVRYSKFYTEEDFPWLSELCNEECEYGLTTDDIAAAPDKFVKGMEDEREKYRKRDRRKPETWHTVHTSIYNLNARSLSVSAQESGRRHLFLLRED